ncbi:uncharacterized protein [Panulirus ornatus]|uniref:uncharacterized protein n=1 Tax=Panulirus ornatus TaxID=150431 RepID=UPI003A843C1D
MDLPLPYHEDFSHPEIRKKMEVIATTALQTTAPNMKCASLLLFLVVLTLGQDYQVADISCDFGEDATQPDGGGHQRLSARLMKPQGFRGHPLFADDREADPFSDGKCQIRHDTQDASGLVYNLLVTDLAYCGVVRKDGYVTLRVWFPQLEGVVLATDQEVIIMCKPASPTVIENRAAGFAGSLPSTGRVSGVVEESPGRLEYEVALYREMAAARSARSHTPVDQAVPIGSRLQIRARINTHSTWKYVKLMEVTVSSDPALPYAPGYVALVKDGCRLPEFASIVPQQPHRSKDEPGEVRLDFEAFMLDSKMAGSSQLWIHATIKACIDARDCLPEFCLDLFQPSGHGRRRRRRKTHYAEGLIEVSASHGESLSNLLPSRNTSLSGPTQHHRPTSLEMTSSLIPNTDLIALSSTCKMEMNATTTTTKSSSSTTLPTAAPEASTQEQETPSPPPDGPSAKIGDNVGITVIMPEEFFTQTEALYQSCATFMILSGLLGLSVLLAAGFLCFLTSRLHKTVTLAHTTTLDSVIKDHHHKYGLRDFLQPPFQ